LKDISEIVSTLNSISSKKKNSEDGEITKELENHVKLEITRFLFSIFYLLLLFFFFDIMMLDNLDKQKNT
jgi:hypothetical protein